MSNFTYERQELTVIVLRVPTRLWDRFEYRHQHYGRAISFLRQHCIEVMGERSSSSIYMDAPDPFFRGQP